MAGGDDCCLAIRNGFLPGISAPLGAGLIRGVAGRTACRMEPAGECDEPFFQEDEEAFVRFPARRHERVFAIGNRGLDRFLSSCAYGWRGLHAAGGGEFGRILLKIKLFVGINENRPCAQE